MTPPLKPLLGIAPVAPETSSASGASFHVLKSGIDGSLHIEYTTTRVVSAALDCLRRTTGVVRPDRSELSEAFKRLRSQLLQRLQADGHSLLAVTSPRAMPGKSLTALNLALAVAAEHDRTVLLVDADLSGQGLQALLGLGGEPGLGEHLSQGRPLDELLVNPGVPRLVFLPGGHVAGHGSAELLATRAMHVLAQELKRRYADRIVIIDVPPMLDNADALSLLPLADTTLLVVEEHHTSIADLEAASSLLAPFNLVGSVLARKQPQTPEKRRRWWQRAQQV